MTDLEIAEQLIQDGYVARCREQGIEPEPTGPDDWGGREGAMLRDVRRQLLRKIKTRGLFATTEPAPELEADLYLTLTPPARWWQKPLTPNPAPRRPRSAEDADHADHVPELESARVEPLLGGTRELAALGASPKHPQHPQHTRSHAPRNPRTA